MKIILTLLLFSSFNSLIIGQNAAQNAELKQLSKAFVSSVKDGTVTNNEAVEFSILRDTVVIHCVNWISGGTEKNEFVYLLPVKSIGNIELSEITEEDIKVNMLSVTCNTGLPDFIFKYGSEKDVRQEMAAGVGEDDVTVYVTVTLPPIQDTSKYERLKEILASFK